VRTFQIFSRILGTEKMAHTNYKMRKLVGNNFVPGTEEDRHKPDYSDLLAGSPATITEETFKP
jgi:hypothetical protein